MNNIIKTTKTDNSITVISRNYQDTERKFRFKRTSYENGVSTFQYNMGDDNWKDSHRKSMFFDTNTLELHQMFTDGEKVTNFSQLSSDVSGTGDIVDKMGRYIFIDGQVPCDTEIRPAYVEAVIAIIDHGTHLTEDEKNALRWNIYGVSIKGDWKFRGKDFNYLKAIVAETFIFCANNSEQK